MDVDDVDEDGVDCRVAESEVCPLAELASDDEAVAAPAMSAGGLCCCCCWWLRFC